jgi:hypothetical protein
MSEHDPDFVSSALNIPKYRFMMILLSAVSLFYLMSFYIIKSQTEETLQKIKKIPCSLLFAVSARDLPDLVKTTAPSDPPLQFSQ